MFDVIIFLILPVHMMVMLPVMFTPANPSFSLCYENKWMDCSFLRNLHDDSSIDFISICEGILAVDGIIFNWEICDGHFPQRKIKTACETHKKLKPCKPRRVSLRCLMSSIQILFNVFFMSEATDRKRTGTQRDWGEKKKTRGSPTNSSLKNEQQ